MLLFKTIKLPFHIRRRKKKNTAAKTYKFKKRKSLNKKAVAMAAVVLAGAVIFKNVFINNSSPENGGNAENTALSQSFAVEPGTYIENGLLDEKTLLAMENEVSISGDGSPEVLVFHTHGSESYADENGVGATVIDAGNMLCEILSNDYGVGVVHDVSIYDSVDGVNTVEGSYERSEEGVMKLLEKYPSVKVLIDLHRDSYNGTEPNCTVYNGKNTAYLMLVNGVCALNVNGEKADAGVESPYIRQNLSFSLKVKNEFNRIAPEVMKRIYIKPYRYSLNMMPCSLLVEAGNENNTLSEVESAMYPLAAAVINVLE